MHPHDTPLDRLIKAFSILQDEHQILACHNLACCGSCAMSLLANRLEKEKEWKGVCVYHEQDVERMINGGDLSIIYDHRTSRPRDTKRLGRLLFDTLEECGLEPEWSGRAEEKVMVNVKTSLSEAMEKINYHQESDEEDIEAEGGSDLTGCDGGGQ